MKLGLDSIAVLIIYLVGIMMCRAKLVTWVGDLGSQWHSVVMT